MSELLKMLGITKVFPGVRALDGVSITVRAGTVHALMGENGAGKSTLMKCLFGVYEKDGGKIFLNGSEVSFKSSAEALEGGVAMVHQELNQALKLTVAENMWLGRFPRVSKYLPFISQRKMKSETERLFSELGVKISAERKMEELSVSERQMAEIAKAVSYGAKIIVFDEPTSSLTDDEAEKLFSIISMLRSRGCGIIYISHKMNEILRIADEVTVMRDGKLIETREADKITTDEIIRLMVGRELNSRYPEKGNTPDRIMLEAVGLSCEYANLKEASFFLRKGEILGIAGLDGSGRTELLGAIFGLYKLKRGRLILNGREIKNTSARAAIKNGFALLTEERRASGIFGILNITENTTISSLKKFSRGPFLSDKKMASATDKYIGRMKIKTASKATKIRSLSGGNQQKVILSRWLLTDPEILMLDEPTRGIDVGAKYEIYTILSELAKGGKGVIVVSSEMPELLGISDRIIVMSGGRVAGEVDAKRTTQDEIMTLAAKYV